jgi:hypothetical protein
MLPVDGCPALLVRLGPPRTGFPRPLVRDVRRAHHQRRAWSPVRKHVDRAQSHVGLAGPALGNNPRGLGCAEILRRAGDGESLRGQRLPQERGNARYNRVFRALQRRIDFENARAELDSVSAQVVEGGLHGDTS